MSLPIGISIIVVVLCSSCTSIDKQPQADAVRTEVDVDRGLIQHVGKETSAYSTQFSEAAAYIEADRLEEALVLYRDLSTASDQKAMGFVGIGSCRMMQMRCQEGLEAYKQAHAMDPHLYDAVLGIAGAYYRLQQYDKAISSYRLAIATDASMPDSYYGLAITYDQEHQGDSAVVYARRFNAMVPGSDFAQWTDEIIKRYTK